MIKLFKKHRLKKRLILKADKLNLSANINLVTANQNKCASTLLLANKQKILANKYYTRAIKL
jgi:hypothetical protein